MERRKLIGYVLIGTITVLTLGGLVAIIGLGQFRTDLNIFKVPEYFWFYRHNPAVMGWLAKGMGGVAAAGALVAFMVFLNPSRRCALGQQERGSRGGLDGPQ